MIKKTLIASICFFVVYNLFLIICKADWTPQQYLYQSNIIKADKYLYNDSSLKGIILGTSLSSRLVGDSLNVYNLGMPGFSPFNGMNILLKKKKLPKFVFVEINYFYKHDREDFIKAFDSKELIYLKTELPALRDENQPIGISFDILLKTTGNILSKIHAKKPRPLNNFPLDTSLFKFFTKEYTDVDVKLINNSLDRLEKNFIEINKRGSRICLFEMPTNPKFMAMPLTKIVRETILKKFPQYTFIPVQNKPFATSDGVHLGEKEAMDYTLYLKDKFRSIGY